MSNSMEASTYLTPLAKFFRHETLQSLGIRNASVPSHPIPGDQTVCDGSGEYVRVSSLTEYDLKKRTARVWVKCGHCQKPLSKTVSLST